MGPTQGEGRSKIQGGRSNLDKMDRPPGGSIQTHQAGRQTDRQTGRQTDKQAYMHTYMHTYRQTGGVSSVLRGYRPFCGGTVRFDKMDTPPSIFPLGAPSEMKCLDVWLFGCLVVWLFGCLLLRCACRWCRRLLPGQSFDSDAKEARSQRRRKNKQKQETERDRERERERKTKKEKENREKRQLQH